MVGLTLASGSSTSAVTRAGLSSDPWDIGPVVVKECGSSGGRKREFGELCIEGIAPLVFSACGCSSFGEVRTSLPFSNNAPPSVAHFRIV